MKNFIKIIIVFILFSIVFQGCRTPYKKRKGCRGKGAWYGSRNLSLHTTTYSKNCMVEQWSAHESHNLKVEGSNPSHASNQINLNYVKN